MSWYTCRRRRHDAARRRKWLFGLDIGDPLNSGTYITMMARAEGQLFHIDSTRYDLWRDNETVITCEPLTPETLAKAREAEGGPAAEKVHSVGQLEWIQQTEAAERISKMIEDYLRPYEDLVAKDNKLLKLKKKDKK